MSYKSWHTMKVRFCDHVECEVALEVQVVYPSEILPDQPPRIIAHRCSQGVACNLVDKPSCVWAGTNPDYDPFAEA